MYRPTLICKRKFEYTRAIWKVRSMASKFHNAVIKGYQMIHFWKLEFNRNTMVCSLSKKYTTCTCNTCYKSKGVYTLAEILSKILEKKIDRKLMTLFTIMTCLFHDLMLTSLLADILYGHCLRDIRLCIRKMLMNRKMDYFQKCDFLLLFIHFY